MTQDRQRVTGTGGFFFRSKDPSALAAWYQEHLRIDPVPKSYSAEPWSQEAGYSAFAPFPQDTGMFGRPEQQWMINFRVDDLEVFAAQLCAPSGSRSRWIPRPIPTAASPGSPIPRARPSGSGSR